MATTAKFVFAGLEDLKKQLRSLPSDLVAGEAGHVVEGAANGAGVSIRSAYGRHRVTGNLQDRVIVQQQAAGPFGVAYVVKSMAKIAAIFERGTEARHYVTRDGKTHVTGRMPPAHIFVPIIVRARRSMYEQLRGVLTRAGLQVSGEP